ncbi:MAG TPA: hypothetical protein PJ982_15980, partial [Lacipirellulaceae bacterium]|nr:hypothetical protein [Lacipirellulaceae bacterium]
MSTRFKRAGAIVLLLAALAVGGTLALRAALQHVEPFYAAAVEVDPAAAAAAALQLEKRVAELATPVAAPQWDVEFTETEVNGWLATVLRDKLPELLPPTVQDPRVQLAENRLLLGFRYIDGAFQSVVAIETEPGLPQPG